MGLVSRLCLVISVCLSAYLVRAAVIRNNTLYRLDIIHFNDFHARFEETSLKYPVCTANDSSCLGGFARLYQEAITLLEQKPEALLLNAGDVFQGTYWYSLLKWDVVRRFINLLPIDAHTIGNHEFDDGVSGLAPYLTALKAPVVVANIDTSAEPDLNGLYRPHIVVERGGRRIGIIGLITTATAKSSSPEKVKFLDPLETVRTEAQKLTNEGVDIIVVLSHCGIDLDKEMAAEVGENIDIIVGGHSHSLLWNEPTGDPANEPVAGPYPVIVPARADPRHKVVIVTASAYTKYLGNLTTYFDELGELRGVEGDPVYLNRSIPEDPTVKSLLQPYIERLKAITREVAGVTLGELGDEACTREECALGDLVADAFLNITQHRNVSNLPHVSLVLRNMIRGALPEGNITRGGIINILPFTNKVMTFSISGADLVTALELCVRSLAPDDQGYYGPYFPHIAGMHVILNTTSRSVQSVSVFEDGEYRPLQPERQYQLVTLKFLLNGGNGFQVFKDNGKDPVPIGVDADIFEQYVEANSPITPYLDKRLVVVH